MQYKENQQYGHWDPYLECWLITENIDIKSSKFILKKCLTVPITSALISI